MDALILNRLGIAIELTGTLLAAPEVVDRLVGIKTLEDLVERSMARLRYFVDLFLAIPPAGVRANVRNVAIVYYSVVYVALLLMPDNPITDAQIGWWWQWRLLMALPVLTLAVAIVHVTLAAWFQAVWKPLRSRGIPQGVPSALRSALLRPLVTALAVAYFVTACLTVPAILPLSTLVRRLQAGWLRLALLVLGITLFIAGLSIQFAATF